MSDLLQIENLTAGFNTSDSASPNGMMHLPALRGVNLKILPGEIVSLVGESGSGKSLTALGILGLIDHPGVITGGKIIFEGSDLVGLDDESMNHIRGRKIAMIFQEPMTALNPVFTIGYQISEVMTTHLGIPRREALKRAVGLLEDVGIREPEMRVHSYPFELSGGMRQRAMIAMALAASPSLLIADEPTTALDVTIQEQILTLLQKLSKEKNMSVLLITHDLGIVSKVAAKTAIMYSGQIVEFGDTVDVLEKRKHPYTQGLLNSIPTFDKSYDDPDRRLKPIRGQVPALGNPPAGCAFADRCDFRQQICDLPLKMKMVPAVAAEHGYLCIL